MKPTSKLPLLALCVALSLVGAAQGVRAADPPAGISEVFGPAIEAAQQRTVKIYGAGIGRDAGYSSGLIVSDDGLILMASDTPAHMEHQPPQGISVSVSGTEVDRLRAIWDGLLDGATVTAPLGSAPWGGDFGMLVDRFGVGWMMSIDTAS